MEEILIRPFEERDNAALLSIEKLCPQGDKNLAMGVDKSPDIIARYKLYDNWKVLVAEDNGKVAGWTGWTVKDNPVQGLKYSYLVEVMVHPESRRKGIASRLITEVQKDAQKAGASYIYSYILEQNKASKALFEELGYSKMKELKICALCAYKKVSIAQEFEIKSIKKNDIGDTIALINNYYSGSANFVPYTQESFEHYLNRFPAYGMDNFWVVKDKGKIVACAGLWDCSVLQEMSYTKEPLSWKVMKGIFAFLGMFGKMPKIPAEGEYFKVHYIVDPAFKKEKKDAMFNLIGHFNNILLDAKQDFFGSPLDPDDAMYEIVKKFSPQVEPLSVFARAFGGKLPGFSPFYGDLRDAIL